MDIGDVGVVTEDGSFDRIFNIYRPPDDPINYKHVPNNFRPLPRSSSNVHPLENKHPRRMVISSAEIRRKDGASQPSTSYVMFISRLYR